MRYQITFSTGKTCEVGPDVRGGIVQAMKVGASVMEIELDGILCVVNPAHIAILDADLRHRRRERSPSRSVAREPKGDPDEPMLFLAPAPWASSLRSSPKQRTQSSKVRRWKSARWLRRTSELPSATTRSWKS